MAVLPCNSRLGDGPKGIKAESDRTGACHFFLAYGMHRCTHLHTSAPTHTFQMYRNTSSVWVRAVLADEVP